MAAPGLVPEIRPEIFESLNNIAVAMDATREDRPGANQESLDRLKLLLRGYTQFDAPKLISIVENMILSALICGTIMERSAIKSLKNKHVAKARQYRALVSQQIGEVIKSTILAKYGRIPKTITANAISKNIQSEVSRILKEKNIRDRQLVVSAITKRVQKLIALDG
jgi:hypothetical protein